MCLTQLTKEGGGLSPNEWGGGYSGFQVIGMMEGFFGV